MSTKTPATSNKRLQARLKAKQALDLRLEGKNYPDISDTLQYSGPGAVYNAIQRLLRFHEHEGVEELRRVEGARLDTMLTALWAKAVTGQKEAVDLVLKIMKRRANLLGLDVPVEVHYSGEVAVKHTLLLKMGDRPPRLIDLSNPNLEALSTEELKAIKDMPIIEAEFKKLPEGKKEKEQDDADTI